MRTIVVVEDQPVLASAYRAKFRGEGFNVEVALDGEQGLDLITRVRPDLVLLDLNLPKLSGLELLKTIRSNPALHAMPVIVFSNLTKPGAVEEAWEAGATLVLSKFNTSPNRVLESVNATLAAGFSEIQDIPVINTESSSHLARQAPKADSAAGQILLVEDNSDLNTLLALLLRQAGHQVTGVGHNADALQQISSQSFDLFLLGRPNKADSGALSLCKQLRQSHPGKPIIVYSTAALFSEQQDGLRAGATAYLVKPEDLFNVGEIAFDLLRSQPVRPRIQVA
jgi:CheY-like chemotaxis protein